jgi:hypothetical protein
MDTGWTLEAGSSRGAFIFCDIFIDHNAGLVNTQVTVLYKQYVRA